MKTFDNIELPFGPPPVLPDVTKQLEDYLLNPERLPIHDYKESQVFWPRKPNPSALYFAELCPPATTLKVIRDPNSGEILDICEVENLDSKQKKISREDIDDDSELDELLKVPTLTDFDFESNFLTIPPGFTQGLEFAEDGCTPISRTSHVNDETLPVVDLVQEKSVVEEKNVVNLINLLNQEQDILGLWKEPAKEPEHINNKAPTIELRISQNDEEEEGVIPKEANMGPVLNISKAVATKAVDKTKWAEEIDISTPVTDFKQKVPNPAFTWPFELDTFQKQAILKLEEGENVFVAAHTSAGKTVVAEYAIATSLRSMQRAIYTSPIKALSNQKFRDFKKVFEEEHKLGEVGLITGDSQLNPKAGCLIMTTEILRSMLYKRNEVINDLSYVIFDEVHYINDKERGHVWEEVVILLPATVSIVMLSATVPNTMEFANWVGCTTKRKVFVISTLKRPVPLQHHLYTGTGRATRNNCFLIRDGDGPLILEGLKKAIASREKKEKEPGQEGGRGGGRGGRGGGGWRGGGGGGGRGGRGGGNSGYKFMGPKQEKQLWEGLIEFLSERDHTGKDKLPVVAFTLSRNRCDTNADLLSNVDLTSKEEKHYIYKFFKQSISRLKEEDQKLPQILKLQKILEKGIGVHHSGILPILKEIVELLFQEGKVKLLFATETFAMGVNMPTRSVVFDSVKKFDGTGTRALLPAEYIQMAGRAGRRGKDPTGTVIILCKQDIPDEHVLKSMMFDKPMKLESQFRMTYAMILKNLQHNMEADVTVENMITRSFKEFPEVAKHSTYRQELAALKKLQEQEEFKRGGVKRPGEEKLEQFFDVAFDYIRENNKYQALAMIQAKAVKELVIGRMVLISYQDHVCKYGIVVGKTSPDTPKAVYRVLVLQNQDHPENPEHSELYYQMVAVMKPKQRFMWDGKGGHTIIKLQPVNILKLTPEIIKIDAEGIIRDWEKRQLPRFRNDPVGPSCKSAIQELALYGETRIYGKWHDIKEDKNLDLAEMRHGLYCLEQMLENLKPTEVLNHQQLFLDVFYRKDLERQIRQIKHKLSAQSSSLFPDFQNKLMFLQELKYINADNVVQMKGKVATSMGTNELMITELVFRNVLTDMQPTEIAALLSGLVFQAKTKEELRPDFLEKGRKEIEKVNQELIQMERECHIGTFDDSSEFDKLNFGLLEVVYEWASNKPFAEIMKLTDVQEGIIVRCIQQLSETLNYVKGAAAQVGDRMLENKMEEVKDLIKRDIVFAASLYTQ
ncbi:SKI2 subunit of superkiller complex protein [Macrosteles quadrilineatus]|uniref:SKI2 subunit of superkiller complex protein n=1 Tax=Macrosteles quadrilineatus TaxID=74068 RepID=UPI0023E17088|nr:SKI2 subunit of superkiller complex protein [Macrosteles quadrilineatus]